MSRSSVSSVPAFLQSSTNRSYEDKKVYVQDVSNFTAKLFDNSQFSDFQIVLTKLQQTLSVYKGILSINSEFFQTLFSSNNFSENLCGQLILDDLFEETALYKIVKSFYTGSLEYSLDEEGLSLLIFSQKYMIQGSLASHLKHEIQMNISPQNCFKLFGQLIKVYDGSFINDVYSGVDRGVVDTNLLHSIMKSVILEMARNFSNILKENISELLALSPDSLLLMLREFSKLSNSESSPTPLMVASRSHRKSSTSLYGSLSSSYSNPYSPSSSSSFTKKKFERFPSSPSLRRESSSSNIVYIRCDGKLFLRFIMDWMIADVEARKDYMAEIKSIEGTFNYSNY